MEAVANANRSLQGPTWAWCRRGRASPTNPELPPPRLVHGYVAADLVEQQRDHDWALGHHLPAGITVDVRPELSAACPPHAGLYRREVRGVRTLPPVEDLAIHLLGVLGTFVVAGSLRVPVQAPDDQTLPLLQRRLSVLGVVPKHSAKWVRVGRRPTAATSPT